VLIGLFELPHDTTAVADDIPLMDPDADNAGMLYTLVSAFSVFIKLATFCNTLYCQLHLAKQVQWQRDCFYKTICP